MDGGGALPGIAAGRRLALQRARARLATGLRAQGVSTLSDVRYLCADSAHDLLDLVPQLQLSSELAAWLWARMHDKLP